MAVSGLVALKFRPSFKCLSSLEKSKAFVLLLISVLIFLESMHCHHLCSRALMAVKTVGPFY